MAIPKEVIWSAEPHTIAKHAILKSYLDAWFPILASRNNRLVYYDGFAGPGRYKDGEEGSPVIALRAARDHFHRIESELVFVFVEQDERRAHWLRDHEVPALELPRNFKVEVQQGEFATCLESALDELVKSGQQIAPTFAFIDPFGVSGLPFTLVRRLLLQKSCEVLVTFMTESIQRFATVLPEHVNELIGDPGAAEHIAATPDRIVAARRLYERSLKSVARFVRFFHLHKPDGRPIYDLFFAGNNPLGHVKMKEAMWRVDDSGSYSFSDGIDPNQVVLFRDDPAAKLAPMLHRRFAGLSVDTSEVFRFVEDETAYLKKHARSALLALEAAPVDAAACLVVQALKRDGRPRRPGTFPDGTVVQFTNSPRTS